MTDPAAAPWVNAAAPWWSRGTALIAWLPTSSSSIVSCCRDALQSRRMIGRRPLVLICFVAALHGLFFIWYQRPDWNTQWSDQDGYRRLGQVLAETGKFTRFPDAPAFVPEVLRTPGYPI